MINFFFFRYYQATVRRLVTFRDNAIINGSNYWSLDCIGDLSLMEAVIEVIVNSSNLRIYAFWRIACYNSYNRVKITDHALRPTTWCVGRRAL
jgi:hypothetical protein